MLLAGLRRLLALVALIAGGTTAVSIGLGALSGASVSRSVSLGLYLVGSLLLIAGFFIGNRGPARPKRDTLLFGPRFMRWATAAETEEALNTSAVFVVLGFALILLGLLADTRLRLF